MTTTKILGDNVPRKSNFDPDLAKKLTRYYEEHPEELNDKPKVENTLSPVLSPVTSIDDFIVLKNIHCIDADDNIFEQYPELHVAKDVFRQANRKHQSFTPYQAIVHSEQQGLFLPSMALSCNIVAALFNTAVEKKGTEYIVKNPEFKKVLDQYKDHGAGYGWQAQNTIVDWRKRKIIHYPRDGDFPHYGGSNNINQSRPIVRSTIPPLISNMSLADALRNAEATKYVHNLTGLEDPTVLVRAGEYFGKTTLLWISSTSESRAAWLGCFDCCFDLHANEILDFSNSARGVHEK